MNEKHLNPISRQSSREEIRSTSDTIFDSLGEYLFEKIVFLNLAYSDLGSGGTTSTTNYGTASRMIDTAEGRLMAPGRESRIRCQFYIKNPDQTEGYILSPAVLDSQTLGSITSLDSLRSYVGIKIYKSDIYVAVKEAGGKEKLFLLDFAITMFSATYTDTFALEIRHNATATEIFLNNTYMGSYSSDMLGSFTKVETFYPFFSPARSTDGTSVNVVAENIQFIQNKS